MLTVESFWRDFSTHLLPHKLAVQAADANYLLAYSGGCDSHVLLHLLVALKRLNYIKNISAVYVNHQLQDDSAQWAEHCVQQCEQYAIACDIVTVNVDTNSGLGLEAAARKARYNALEKKMDKKTLLLTAQHADDQVETFLLQSLRGGGVKGLASMPVVKAFSSGVLCRPLLHVTQSKITEYAKANKLEWLEDPSNDDTNYDRNFLRQQVIPILKQRWPSLNKTVHRLTQHQAEAANLIDDLAALDLATVENNENLISIAALVKLSLHRQKNVLRYWIEKHNNLTMPDSTHLMRILNEVVVAADDAQPSVSWSDTVIRRFQACLFALKKETSVSLNEVEIWEPNQIYSLYNNETQLITCSTTGKGLSIDKLVDKTVSIRFRNGGEVCCPQGRGPHQHKLKNLFQEWQVPPWLRSRVPLVFVDGVLAQVVGYCVCEPFAAHPDESAYDISLKK